MRVVRRGIVGVEAGFVGEGLMFGLLSSVVKNEELAAENGTTKAWRWRTD